MKKLKKFYKKMGNEINEKDYSMSITFIGKSLHLLKLFFTREIINIVKASDKKEKKSIFDFWDYYTDLGRTIWNK